MKKRYRRRLCIALIAFALLTSVNKPVPPHLPDSSPPREEHVASLTYCAPFGSQRTVDLPDRSRIDLNSGTCATLLFTASERIVRLSPGEAVFSVAPDRNRPFSVQTQHHSIAVVGTKFDVYATPADTHVTVLEGAVSITPLETAVHIDSIAFTAGQQIDIVNDQPNVQHVRRIGPVDVQRMTAWVNGYIVLDGRTLAEVLTEFQRYEHVVFRSKDPEILGLKKFGGTVPTKDIRGFLKSLRDQCVYSSSHDELGQRVITLTRNSDGRMGHVCH